MIFDDDGKLVRTQKIKVAVFVDSHPDGRTTAHAKVEGESGFDLPSYPPWTIRTEVDVDCMVENPEVVSWDEFDPNSIGTVDIRNN